MDMDCQDLEGQSEVSAVMTMDMRYAHDMGRFQYSWSKGCGTGLSENRAHSKGS